MIFATIYKNEDEYTITGRLDSGADVQLDRLDEELLQAVQTIAAEIDAHKAPELAAAELRARELESVAQLAQRRLDDVMAYLTVWRAGIQLTKGQLVWYDGRLYTVVQAHTTQDDWSPPVTDALFTEANKTSQVGDEVLTEWRQPTGAHDAYNTGDKVTYNGQTWQCRQDAAVHAPGVVPGQWEVVPE